MNRRFWGVRRPPNPIGDGFWGRSTLKARPGRQRLRAAHPVRASRSPNRWPRLSGLYKELRLGVHQRFFLSARGLHGRPRPQERRESGGPPEQITHVGEVLQLRWSPAGNLFAIQTLPFGTIVVMAPDGSDPRIVATDAFLGEFSPDGNRLALVREADGHDDIGSPTWPRGGLTPIVAFAVEGFTSHLAWSPDGTRLAFDRTDCPGGTGCGDPHVIVTDARGTASYPVAVGTDPSWSPDSQQLAFSGPLGEVRVVPAGGGRPAPSRRARWVPRRCWPGSPRGR